MLTRCPHCETTFRVTPEQLKARQGQVRCGTCQGIFNALDFLVEEVKLSPLPSLPPETVSEPEPLPVAEPEIVPEPESVPEPEPAPVPEAATEPEPAPEPEPDLSEPPVDEAERVPDADETPPRRWPWAVGAFFALVLLLLQATIHFRVELSVLYPEARPLLAEFCAVAGCDLPLPRKPGLIGIESSDLHPGTDGQLQFSALIRNRAPFAQGYPHLELTLTDLSDQALVRRVLSPSDYLPPNVSAAAGFAANGELAINLALEATAVSAAGYRLYLFYP